MAEKNKIQIKLEITSKEPLSDEKRALIRSELEGTKIREILLEIGKDMKGMDIEISSDVAYVDKIEME